MNSMNPGQVCFSVSPDPRWVGLIESAARQYFGAFSFKGYVLDMIAAAVTEVCEEIVRRYQADGIESPYEVSFGLEGEAASISVSYGHDIALDLAKETAWTEPSSEADLDALNVDALWLREVRGMMDRVFIKRDGRRYSIEMLKYRRAEGRDKETWIMGIAPELRENVVIEHGEEKRKDGLPSSGLLIDSSTGAVLKLDGGGLFVVERLDGRRTFRDIYMEYVDRVGLISPRRLMAIFARLEGAGMLKSPGQPGKKGWWTRVTWYAANPYVMLVRPDAAVTAIHRAVRWLINPSGTAAILILGLSAVIPVLLNRDRFMTVLMDLHNFYALHPLNLLPLGVLMILILSVHELGHAVVCKHYGGTVHRMGVMFYLAMIIFFCDTSSAWNFSSKYKRIAVSLAGPLTTFGILGILTWVSIYGAEPGSRLESISMTAVLGCLAILVTNFNPFIRMDAYYILIDLIGIPNLRQRSFQYIAGKITARFAGVENTPPANRREKAIFWAYGLGGAVMTVLFIVLPLWFLGSEVFKRHGPKAGIAVGTLMIIITVVSLVRQAFLKTWLFTHRKEELL